VGIQKTSFQLVYNMQRNADMKKGSATKVDRPLALQKRLFDISQNKSNFVWSTFAV